MIQYLTIPLDDVYVGIGTVYHDYPADTRLRPARPWDKVASYGLMLYWPRKDPWLSVDVVAQASPTSPPVTFASHREAVEAVCRQHGVDVNRIAPAGFLAAAEVRVGSLTNTSSVTLRLAIDTSHDAFRAAVRERGPAGKTELVQTLHVRMFDTRSLGSYFEQAGTVQLILRPAIPVPVYYGVAALDLGNTSSDLACVSKRDPVYRTSSLKLLDAEPTRPALADNPFALVSAVRIDRIISLAPPPAGTRRFPELPEDDSPRAIEYVAGALATAGGDATTPGLVLGAKRLVCGRDADRYRPLVAFHRRESDAPEMEEEVEVQNRIPAELLACRLLEKFRAAAKAWPAELAVTYPTTFTPRELARLTQAVERGWLRMQGQPQRVGGATPPDDPDLARLVAATQARLAVGGDADGTESGIVRLKLDEATAAAFFFLYRRIFESPGGLLRFRYLHPDGLNLLLYDCGGGTTDIALVRATAVSPQHLRIGVLGRTGLRGFGGDDMTRAVARLLKGKLVAELLRTRGKAPPGPPGRSNDPAAAREAIEGYLRMLADLDPHDHLVPTRFDPTRRDADTRERRRFALELWRWAEKLKADLGASGSARFGGVQKFRDALAEPILAGLTDAQVKAAESQLRSVTLHRWEADALIDGPTRRDGQTINGPITRSVAKCNRLIQQLLRDRKAADGLPEEDVHWVVVSGNAARYPLVRERIVQKLEVDDLDERLTLDEVNLKHAVAKGAALFLVTTRTPGLQVVIDTEVDLSACLPFDVGYFDLARREHRPLFREHQKYTELTPRRVPMMEAANRPAEEMRTFFLERRFPGDDEYGRFLAFEFRDGIRGELEVRYDPAAHQFGVTDTATGAVGEVTDLTDAEVYVAPPERGDI